MKFHSTLRLAGKILFLLGLVVTAQAQTSPTLPPLRGYLSAHDPSTIVQCNGRYYQFSTGHGILSKSSADKVFWKPGPPVFTALPAWTTNTVPGFYGDFWAPDVLYFNGTYHLYYTVSTWGNPVCAIGLVTNPTLDPSSPSYKWTDQGQIIVSTGSSSYSALDPSICWDNTGNLWMSFGSYRSGVNLVQLDSSTGLCKSPGSPTIYQLANSGVGSDANEASYIWKRGGYYYLFVNWGYCCEGVNSTYNIRVGRATSITGPYLDQNGVSMLGGGGTPFLRANGKYAGPGHVGILNEGGVLSLTHHYYDANVFYGGQYGAPTFALLPLSWTADDWPVVNNDWAAAYNFQADARDDNGQNYGLLQGGASVAPDPVYGHVLNLNSNNNQYSWLPPAVGYGQTYVAVVNWFGGAKWQRIFDFGYDTSRCMYMTPASSDSVLRFDINPGGNSQTIQWNQPLRTNAWTQVAITLSGQRGILYVNGAPVATNNSMASLPMNLASQTNHLGRSKFSSDPYFNGQIASFRAYGRVLTPAEIAGPLPVITQPAGSSAYQPGGVINFAGSAVDYLNRPLAGGNLSWQISYAQYGQTNVVFGPINGIKNGTFNVPSTNTGGGTYLITLTATDTSNRVASAVATVTAANPPASWTAYYPLKSNASDSNSLFNGTLMGGASFINDATRGDVLNLDGTNQFVSLPSGLAGMKTFMAWVKWNGGAAWQRIFDFGRGTNRYTVLTPLNSDTGTLRFNISINGRSGEQRADAPAALPSNVWTHVTVVLNSASAVLYTNGAPVATNLFANLLPVDLNATNFFLGKSEWPTDPYFRGQLSSIRISSRALAANEIVAPQITITQPAHGTTYSPGATINFAGSANDFYDASIMATGLTWTVRFINGSITNVVYGPVKGAASGAFTVPASGSAATNGFYQILLSAVDTVGRLATNNVSIFPVTNSSPGWSSFYPFTSGAQDASNKFNGTLQSGASIVSDPEFGNVLGLIPSRYVSLPAGAGNAQTISGWVKWSGGAAWQRIFDFGQNQNALFILTPAADSGLPRCAISPDVGTYNQIIESPMAFPTNQWVQFGVVMDGRQGIFYLNGNAVAVNNSINLLPSDLAPANVFWGKSEASWDPYFNGKLSAVRLNSAAISVGQLKAGGAPPTVVFQETFNEVPGTPMVGLGADVGGVWNGTAGSPPIAISSQNSLDTSGDARTLFATFTAPLGAGQTLTLSYDTLKPTGNFLAGWSGVSLYSGGNEQFFTGNPVLGQFGINGIVGQHGNGDSNVVNHVVFTYVYDTGAYSFTTKNGTLSGVTTAGLPLNQLRVANGGGGDMNLANLVVNISKVNGVFKETFTKTPGTPIAGLSADVGGIWNGTAGSPPIAISSLNSLDTSGSTRILFNTFTATLGTGQMLTLRYDTLAPSPGNFLTGWSGVSLYSGGNEQFFVGNPALAQFGINGIVGQHGDGDSNVVNHVAFTYVYNTGVYTFATKSGTLSGVTTAGLPLNQLRVANGGGGDMNLANLFVDFSMAAVIPAPSVAIRSMDTSSVPQMVLEFSGTMGQPYSIHATTNLMLLRSSWPVIGTGIFSSSPVTLVDPDGTNFVSRFYYISVP